MISVLGCMLGIAIKKRISVLVDTILILITAVLIIGGCCGGDEGGESGGGWGGGWPGVNDAIDDRKVTCTSLGGVWQDESCNPYDPVNPQDSLTSQVEDNEGQNGNVACCKSVETVELIINTIPDQNVSEDATPWSIDLLTYATGQTKDLRWNIMYSDPALVIASISGNLLNFELVPNAFGSTQLTVVGMNKYAHSTTQTIKLKIDSVLDAPTITSTPIVDAFITQGYQYQLDIFDPDSTIFNYNLSQGPDRMSVTNSGIVTWAPLPSDDGNLTQITIQVIDESDLKSSQTYNLRVWP